MRKMKPFKNAGHLVTVYQDDDLIQKTDIIRKATEMWREKTIEFLKQQKGDFGSCVLGAGISVYYLPKRKRVPVRHRIISTYSLPCQGSINWEHSKDEIIKYLEDNGFENVLYDWGTMD